MSAESIAVIGILEECLDQLDEYLSTLQEYPPTVLAYALRIQLVAMLRELNARGACTRGETVTFLKDLEREVLEADEPEGLED
jgi:hypothetical protein